MTTPASNLCAEGFGSGGERWTLNAHASGGRLRAMVEVVEPGGRRWVAGSGGRALPAGRRVATFIGRSGDGAGLLIVRVAGDVRAVVAVMSGGSREDLRLHGDPAMLGARIAVLVHPGELQMVALRLIGIDGSELADEL